MTPGKRIALSVLAVAGLVLTACGSDSDSSADTTAAAASDTTTAAADTTAAEATDTTEAAAETTAGEAADASSLDTNGDGTVVLGVAAAGPRDDGAYYQALVDKITSFSADNGFGDPVVVDNITAEDAATELGNLADQGVDAIFVGASEIADPLADLVTQFPDIFWYCNCGAGYPATDRAGPEPGRFVRDQLLRRLRHGSADEGQERSGHGPVHRLLRPERSRRRPTWPGSSASRPSIRPTRSATSRRVRSRSTSTTPPARPRHSMPPSPTTASVRSTRTSVAPTSRS